MRSVTKLGKCTRCRTRTAITAVKVEAYPGDAFPVHAELCDVCIDKTQVATLTPTDARPQGYVLTELYQ